MIIDSLIRLGRPLISGGFPPREIIKQISDIGQDTAKDFFENIFFVEVHNYDGNFTCKALPRQVWGNYEKKSPRSKKEVFYPDIDRAVGVPFIVPAGGNKLKPQGFYSIPVFVTYEKQLKSFRKPDKVTEFLKPRIERTVGLEMDQEYIEKISEELAARIEGSDISGNKGLIILTIIDDDSPFSLLEKGVKYDKKEYAFVTFSQITPEKIIVSYLDTVLERFWVSKVDEGRTLGHKKGEDAKCFFCPNTGEVVSAYCKASPWYTSTWKGPFPITLKDKEMVEAIALCPDCYKSLVYGANLFMKILHELDYQTNKELFAPVGTVAGKDSAISSQNITRIYGTVIPLPVLDGKLEPGSKEHRDFVEAMDSWINDKPGKGAQVELQLKNILGFESNLPATFNKDDYRLNIFYLTGDFTKKDIHLVCAIEDVLPSTARKVQKILKKLKSGEIDLIIDFVYEELSENHRSYLVEKYSSLFRLLLNSYGGPYLWITLEKVLHREKLSEDKFIKNVCARMQECSKKPSDNFYKLKEEALFFLVFKTFINEYNSNICEGGGEKVRDWKELKKILQKDSPVEIELQDSEEVGFAAGILVRDFSKRYWHETKEGNEGKDFIKDRVMTFGSSLTPDVIWKRALSRIEEYERKLNFRLSQDYHKKVAVWLMSYSRLEKEISRNKDKFMAAFWAGYALADSEK